MSTFTLSSGVESVQGRRWTMEDTHVLIDDLNSAFNLPSNGEGPKRAYYAVYDGHGGKNAADITAEILHKNIIEDTEFQKGNINEAILNGFKKTDNYILKTATNEKWTNGTTTVTVFVVNNKLIISNTGDSEAVLAQQDQTNSNGEESIPTAVLLTEKHKPTEILERQRVEKAGGHVIFGRIEGSLAVSKALGDIDFKHPYNNALADFVSAVPYINTVEIDTKHPFMVVACDGLWDKLTYQEAVDFVAKYKKQGKNPTEIAKLIVEYALDQGTLDNVTVVIVFFTWD